MYVWALWPWLRNGFRSRPVFALQIQADQPAMIVHEGKRSFVTENCAARESWLFLSFTLSFLSVLWQQKQCQVYTGHNANKNSSSLLFSLRWQKGQQSQEVFMLVGNTTCMAASAEASPRFHSGLCRFSFWTSLSFTAFCTLCITIPFASSVFFITFLQHSLLSLSLSPLFSHGLMPRESEQHHSLMESGNPTWPPRVPG